MTFRVADVQRRTTTLLARRDCRNWTDG